MNVIKKILLCTGLVVGLSACQPNIYITSETVIKHTPSRSQERHPRGEVVFACTTVAAMYEYLENGGISAGCGNIAMTAPRYRDDFYTFEGVRYKILEFQVGWYTYYTFERVRGRSYGYR